MPKEAGNHSDADTSENILQLQHGLDVGRPKQLQNGGFFTLRQDHRADMCLGCNSEEHQSKTSLSSNTWNCGKIIFFPKPKCFAWQCERQSAGSTQPPCEKFSTRVPSQRCSSRAAGTLHSPCRDPESLWTKWSPGSYIQSIHFLPFCKCVAFAQRLSATSQACHWPGKQSHANKCPRRSEGGWVGLQSQFHPLRWSTQVHRVWQEKEEEGEVQRVNIDWIFYLVLSGNEWPISLLPR